MSATKGVAIILLGVVVLCYVAVRVLTGPSSLAPSQPSLSPQQEKERAAALEKQRQAQRNAAAAAGRAAAAGNRDESLSLEACQEAIRAVRPRLKAPATAKFPGCVFGAHEYEIRADETRSTWWVLGHVDSQNSFGAMIRTKWIVKLTHKGDNWKVQRVEFE